MNKIKNISIFLIVMFLATMSVKAQDWEIPEENQNITNPLEINSETIENGFELYSKNCQSCHGEVGKANFIALTPSPGDLGAESFKSANTPGAIFYKITQGKVAMPSFKATLNEDDRWAIVAFLNPQGGDPSEETEIVTASNQKLNVSLKEENHTILIAVKGDDSNGNEINVSGSKIEVYAKRNFGNLLLGKGKTNAKGFFSVEFPTDLPGDSLGNVKVIIKVPDSKLEENIDINWGGEFHAKDMTEQASIWGTNSKAPWWIILLYVGIAGTVWSVIVYIVFQIIKILKIGKKGATPSL